MPSVRSVCDTDDKQMLKVVGRSGASATRGGAAMMPELESVPLGQRHSSQRLRRPAARCRRSGGGLRMRPGVVTGGIETNQVTDFVGLASVGGPMPRAVAPRSLCTAAARCTALLLHSTCVLSHASSLVRAHAASRLRRRADASIHQSIIPGDAPRAGAATSERLPLATVIAECQVS